MAILVSIVSSHAHSKPGPQKTSVAREWICKHVSMATKSPDHSNRYTRNNRGTAGGSVLCWVHAEAIYRKLKPMVRQTSVCQWWPDMARSQWPGGAMRQSVAGKDMNTEAEEPPALGAVTKLRLVKTQQTEMI
jgi:hypothetical protein